MDGTSSDRNNWTVRLNEPLKAFEHKRQEQPEIIMTLAFTLAFAAAALVEAAGYFLRLNKNLVAGARTLIIMVGVWFAVTASRETVTPKGSPSEIKMGCLASHRTA
jgi:hypothetical protein